ncbi:general stress protein [Oceanobacillus rekensis]|uniref:general stress protein n=1 Tax=Oceanobacillus rekensis TaxID=937927 RepID=UPI000B440145|nr:general stress protein [Oceanobacillus rekensis]
MDNKLIGGVFSNVKNAEKAIKDLQAQGYGKEDISVFAKNKDKVKDIEEETNTDVSSNKGGRGKNAGKGVGIGAASGGVLGGISGLIVEAGLLTIPGVGPLLAAGPLATTLAGLGIGASGGGLVGALVGAGIPEEQAKQYEQYLKDGKVIVLVEANENNENFVYGTFLTNDTVNKTMYPEAVTIVGNDSNKRY